MASYPREWRQAAGNSEWVLFLTPDELKQLNDELAEVLVSRFRERFTDPSKRPPGALPVEYLLFSYPIAVPGAESGGDPESGEPPTSLTAAPHPLPPSDRKVISSCTPMSTSN